VLKAKYLRYNDIWNFPWLFRDRTVAFEEDFFERSLDFFSKSKIPCNLKQEEEPRLLNRLFYVLEYIEYNVTVMETWHDVTRAWRGVPQAWSDVKKFVTPLHGETT
jgi:hypothetical protein